MAEIDEHVTRRELEARFEALREQISAQKESVTIAMAAADRAVTKAETAVEKRFESMNEFRGALNDSARLMMPRNEAEQSFRILSEKIDEVSKRQTSKEDHGAGMSQGWLILVSVVSVLSTVVMVIYYLSRPHT